MALSLIAIAMAAANPAPALYTEQQQSAQAEAELSARELAQGRHGDAIAALEQERKAHPNDPALLINLGIAYAREGDEDRARSLFKQAMGSREVVDLETADGKATDSRRLARKALSMLDRGEFLAAK